MKSIFFVLFTLTLLTSQASLASIYISYSEKVKNYEKIAKKIKTNLNQSGVKNIYLITSENEKNENIKKNNLTVFIGDQAPEKYKKLENPTIFSFSRKAAIDNEKIREEWSIVDINQPIDRLLITAKKTIKKQYKNNILFIVSEKNISAIEKLKLIQDESIKIVIVERGETAAKLIEPELRSAAAIIALYDPTIWSGNSARWILQQAYTYKVPIVGYSKAFLKAGAMASVYSSADQITKETEKHILRWAMTGKLNNKKNNPEYTIEINNNIAKALNFNNIEIIEMSKKQ